ncbi:unnamed protein product [Echinostoma caproni]|uniref:Uncharacterized protein n=1 Tax=Echinostoma caproni TaxID=27848 RepID=A0A183A5C5_9TREM|nr:unnamed protein product [Echinostoma caproni]
MGSGSRSGSDDGMERIALVHSHSRSTLTGTQTSPGLAYMVLSATQAGVGMSTPLAGDPIAVTATSSPRYYTRGSDSSETNTGGPNGQPTLQDLPNTAIPLQASAHNIIVSLLPCLPTSSAGPVSSSSSQHTPSGSMVAAWSPELDNGPGIGGGLPSPEVLDPATPATSQPSFPHSSSTQTECWVYSIPQRPPISSNVVVATSTCGNGGKLQTPELTSTTQILVAPVCSILTDTMSTKSNTVAPEVDCPSDMIDVIAPVSLESSNWRIPVATAMHSSGTTSAGGLLSTGTTRVSISAPVRNTTEAAATTTTTMMTTTATNPVVVNEGKLSLLHPHRTKTPYSRDTASSNPAGRLWRTLTRPFRPTRSRCNMRSRSPTPSAVMDSGNMSISSPPVCTTLAPMAPFVSGPSNRFETDSNATEQVVVAQVESTNSVNPSHTGVLSVIPPCPVDPTHSISDSNPSGSSDTRL